MDHNLSLEDGQSLGFSAHALTGYRSDLTPSEDVIFAGMTSAAVGAFASLRSRELQLKRRVMRILPRNITIN